MNWNVEELPWLPAPPDDFRLRCRTLDGATSSWSREIRFLANHRLDGPQLTQLAKAIELTKPKPTTSKRDDGLSQLKLGLLCNATTKLISPCLTASAARHGILLEVVETPFDQVMQQAADPASELCQAKPDVTLLALDTRSLPLSDSVDAAIDQINDIRRAIRRNTGAPVIVQNIARIPAPQFGSFDRTFSDSTYRRVLDYNTLLESTMRDSGDYLLDVASLAEDVGLLRWHNLPQWYTAKLPFSQSVVPLYADFLVRIVAALRGKTRKCLVLDLDNTLWGGVIGDDGLDGIAVGQGSPNAEAFIAIQQTALNLRSRGIVLAVSSKNDNEIARLPFRRHPDMLLKEEHIAVFRANWEDKATNLMAISETLDIGTDALVLLDDNMAERAYVRSVLPEVGIPELPEDPTYFPRALLFGGYFEAVAFSAEDRSRAAAYQANAERAQLRETIGDVAKFLKSLNMTITFAEFDGLNRSRIAQLINRSNQFNLTSRRYTEAEIAEMEEDTKLFTLQVRLADRFGDNGMICVVICREDGNTWNVDTWVMSCRVLGRRVEEAVLVEIVRAASSAGIVVITGQYIDSGRNRLVRDHFQRLGFSFESGESTSTRWRLAVGNFVPPLLPFAEARYSSQKEKCLRFDDFSRRSGGSQRPRTNTYQSR